MKYKPILNYLLAATIGAFFLPSCYTVDKAKKQSEKAIDKFPKETGELFRNKYPCIEKKVDTSFITYDTTINVSCPDTTIDTSKDYFTVHDTIVTNNTKKVTIKIPGKVITKYIEDSSKIKELSIAINDANENTKYWREKCTTLKEKLDKVKSTRNKLWYLVILLLIFSFRKQLFSLIRSKIPF